MFIEAINTVQVRAYAGTSDALGIQLCAIVDALRATTECLAYALVRSHADDDLWIITGHWKCAEDMHAHFSNPRLNELMNLLYCRTVSRIDCNSFSTVPTQLAY